MKVHVTLKRSVQMNRKARDAALARVLQESGIRLTDRKRFERYGIISGEANPARLEMVKDLPEVEAVEIDEERFVS
jgi:hypothetical protein